MARHGENIDKRKDGRWEGRYIKGRSETGKAIWGYVYAYSYVDAKSALIRKKVKTADYTVPLGAQELTFSVLSHRKPAAHRKARLVHVECLFVFHNSSCKNKAPRALAQGDK